MPLSKLPFAPGVNREGSQYTIGPTFWDMDKVRFRKGLPEQIGGWEQYGSSYFKGIARSLFDWTTAASQQYLGIGTNLKFYVEKAEAFYDITPIRLAVAGGSSTVTFSIVADLDATLVVDHIGHGAYNGDYVEYSGAVSLGGNITADVLNQEYKIASIIDADSYYIEAKDPSTGDPVLADSPTDTGNGGSNVAANYQINIGTNTYNTATGWGSGGWGEVAWGGGGALTFQNQLRLYSQDAFGDDLIFNPRLGDIYYWDESASSIPSSAQRAVSLSDVAGANNPPTKAMQVMVSPVDRHLIAFGCNDNEFGTGEIDPLLVRWADQESIIEWNPSATNSAGGQPLATGTSFVGAVKTRQEILIFMDTAIHAMRFSGAPYVFTFSVIAENVSICSPKAAVAVGDSVFFMDLDGFYVYRGAIQRVPCSVLDHVFNNLDKSQAYKVFAVNNPDDNEVTWFYPVGTSPADITNYVTFNYAEELWSIGTFQRGAWIQAASRGNPIAASNDQVNIDQNFLYKHEFGWTANGGDIGGWYETGMIEIADGEHLAFMTRFIPDFRLKATMENASFTITIKGTNFPMEALTDRYMKTLDYAANSENFKQTHVRVRAREIALKVESSGNGYGWTAGTFRFDMRMDGRR